MRSPHIYFIESISVVVSWGGEAKERDKSRLALLISGQNKE